MSDWTHEEYKAILTRLQPTTSPREFAEVSNKSTSPIDWRDEGCVNAVQDQGGCGSCWAFASVQSMEGRHCNASGKLLKFSEQQLVDCSTHDSGCNGGLEAHAYKYY